MFFDNDLRITYLMKGEAMLWCGVEKVGFMKTFITNTLGTGRTKEITITNPQIPLFPVTLKLIRASLSTIYWEAQIHGANLETVQIRYIQESVFRKEVCILTYKGMDVMRTGRSFAQILVSPRRRFTAVIESGPPFAHSAKFLTINRGWADTPSLVFGLTSDPLCNSLVLALSQVYDCEQTFETSL